MLLTTSFYHHNKSENSLSADINDLLQGGGDTCVSIIVPTHRVGPERQGDRLEIQNAVHAAKQQIPAASVNILNALDELFFGIDYMHNQEGLGLFVSPSVKKLVKFPFPVRKKIVVDRFFNLQDLLYAENYCVIYYLLEISRKEIHLYRGTMDHLEEIKEGNLPKLMTEEYEYNKPSQSNSASGYARVKDPEKDKSILRQIRLKNVFRDIDKSLSGYLKTGNIPLLISGPEKDIFLYKSVTSYTNHLAGSISDVRTRARKHDMAQLVWPQLRSFLDKEKLKLVAEMREKIGNRSAIAGIDPIWEGARGAKNLTLLVEKDYNVPGAIIRHNKIFSRGRSKERPPLPDVVNEIITTVLQKGGEVVILEKDMLKDFERIALILH